MFIIVLIPFYCLIKIRKKNILQYRFLALWKGGGGGGEEGGPKLFNENLLSIFDMGPLIDFRLTIQ